MDYIKIILVSCLITSCGGKREVSDENPLASAPAPKSSAVGRPISDQVSSILQITSAMSISEKILTIRQFVYENAYTKEEPTGLISPDNLLVSLKTIEAVGVAPACGNYSLVYSTILKSYGIPARVIQLATSRYLSGENQYDTHVTVEILDTQTGTWFISDPTFNTSFSCGELIAASLSDLRSCVSEGLPIIANNDGIEMINGHTVSDYPIPYENFTAASFTYSLDLVTPDAHFNYGAISVPESWVEESKSLYE